MDLDPAGRSSSFQPFFICEESGSDPPKRLVMTNVSQTWGFLMVSRICEWILHSGCFWSLRNLGMLLKDGWRLDARSFEVDFWCSINHRTMLKIAGLIFPNIW